MPSTIPQKYNSELPPFPLPPPAADTPYPPAIDNGLKTLPSCTVTYVHLATWQKAHLHRLQGCHMTVGHARKQNHWQTYLGPLPACASDQA